MNGAIVSLCVGTGHQALWQKYCRSNWETYAKKHNLDLVLLNELIDRTERGRNRSPAWQKLLIGRIPELRRYRKIAWVDSDIVINSAKAPSIFENIPSGRIGAVRSQVLFENPLFKDAFQKTCGPFPSLADYNWSIYQISGLSPFSSHYVNTGVLAFADFDLDRLEPVYFRYDPQAKSFQEQVFLSYELVKAGILWELNPLFNVEWYPFKYSVYDFANGPLTELKTVCLRQLWAQSYFLHFNGNQEDMPYLDTSIEPRVGNATLETFSEYHPPRLKESSNTQESV